MHLAGGQEPADHLRIDTDRIGQFPFGDTFFGRVGNVNAARTDQVWLTPSAVEGGNVRGESNDGGGEIGEGIQTHGGIEENFTGFDFVRLSRFRDGKTEFRGFGDEAEHNFGAGFIGDDVGGAASMDRADVESGLAKNGVAGKREGTDLGESIKKRMDGGMAEFGIGRMGKLAASNKLIAQDALGTESDAIFGGFAINEKAGTAGRGSGGGRASTVALFANDEEKGEVARAGSEERFRRVNHGSDDAFGVATAAAMNVGVVLRGRKIRRDGVHVSGKSHDGIAEGEKDIIAIWRGREALDTPVVAGSESGKMGEQEIDDRLFVSGGGIEIDERAS